MRNADKTMQDYHTSVNNYILGDAYAYNYLVNYPAQMRRTPDGSRGITNGWHVYAMNAAIRTKLNRPAFVAVHAVPVTTERKRTMALTYDKSDNTDTKPKPRAPSQSDLERVVGHFLHYLSNEPDSAGISPRCRLYGMLPVESKLLFPDVSDDVLTSCVTKMLRAVEAQRDILPRTNDGSWRSYS